jgi:3-oxoacyl-[acyl-carrier protein] reductase
MPNGSSPTSASGLETHMELGLKGKAAIVGGASMGIGYGIARQLAADGARIAITARREPGLAKAAEALRTETGAEILPLQADCRRAEDCERVVDSVARAFGSIDILVNNDGAPPLGPLTSFDDAAWAKAVEQNLMYVVRMSRAAVPHMKAGGGGGILNITAISAIQPIAGFGLSVATWAGVIGFAKTLSLEVACDNINVNTICPGYIETQRLEKVFAAGGEDPAAMRRQLEAEVPMGRIGSVEDISGLVALLVSPRGRYITGATIQVDGGLLRGVR